MAENETEVKEVEEKNMFGIPKISTNTEVAISFTLFAAANIILGSQLYTLNLVNTPVATAAALNALAYFFIVEAVRELEEKDHFLAEKLINK